MPIYEYIAEQPDDKTKSCFTCRKVFELRREMNRAKELNCPLCGHPIKKVPSRVNSSVSESYTDDKAKRAGFTVLNNAGHGKLEKS